MISKKRIEIAMGGGKPDRVPVFPIYDWGYVARSVGGDIREFIVGSSGQRTEMIRESFLRHRVDGLPRGIRALIVSQN